MGLIYLIRNKVNNKGYVGRTIQSLEARRKCHLDNAQNGEMWALSCAIRKYGVDAFEWSILHQDDDNDRDWMDWWECHFIRKLKTKSPNGYNMTDGGEGLCGATELTRKRIGDATRNKPLSEEHKKKISNATTGKKKSPETILRMKAAQKARVLPQDVKERIIKAVRESVIGKKLTEEHKRKVSEGLKRAYQNPELRRKISEAGMGRKHTEETKLKLREFHLRENLSAETRRKMSESKIGKKHTEETKLKISKTKAGKPSTRIGYKHSEETRAKMRAARLSYLASKKNQ